MAVEIGVVYEGDLRCTVKHGPSGATFVTDAPVDNHGRGESFSPTDLAATSLGSCVLTIMAIAARARGIALDGATATVTKHMVADPNRRIGRIVANFELPRGVSPRDRAVIEAAGRGCPVKRSLGEAVDIELNFDWDTAE